MTIIGPDETFLLAPWSRLWLYMVKLMDTGAATSDSDNARGLPTMYTNKYAAENALWTKEALVKRDNVETLYARADRRFEAKERAARLAARKAKWGF